MYDMFQIILLVGVSYSGYQLSMLNMSSYSLSRPSRAGFLQLREYGCAYTIFSITRAE